MSLKLVPSKARCHRLGMDLQAIMMLCRTHVLANENEKSAVSLHNVHVDFPMRPPTNHLQSPSAAWINRLYSIGTACIPGKRLGRCPDAPCPPLTPAPSNCPRPAALGPPTSTQPPGLVLHRR